MISKDKIVEIIISKAKSYGVEKGYAQIMPEILEDKDFFFFGLMCKDPLGEPAGLAFIGKKDTGGVHDIDMEIEWPYFEEQYEKMQFDDVSYRKLCEYLEKNHKESWLFLDEE